MSGNTKHPLLETTYDYPTRENEAAIGHKFHDLIDSQPYIITLEDAHDASNYGIKIGNEHFFMAGTGYHAIKYYGSGNKEYATQTYDPLPLIINGTDYSKVFEEGALTAREKSLIALAVAHTEKCPYCIDAYTKDGLQRGITKEEMMEAVHVGAAIKAGVTLVHGVQMMNKVNKLDG